MCINKSAPYFLYYSILLKKMRLKISKLYFSHQNSLWTKTKKKHVSMPIVIVVNYYIIFVVVDYYSTNKFCSFAFRLCVVVVNTCIYNTIYKFQSLFFWDTRVVTYYKKFNCFISDYSLCAVIIRAKISIYY